MIGVADIRYCEHCRRARPHNRQGDCKECKSRRKRAARVARSSTVGQPLIRYGVLLKAADDAWSVWLRAFWPYCEMCQAFVHPHGLQCAHGFSRVERVIRFDPDNTFALCPSCHRRHTPPRADWWEWMQARLARRARLGLVRGGADPFTRLQLASKARGGKLTAYALHGVLADVRARIAQLTEGERKEWAEARLAQILDRLS